MTSSNLSSHGLIDGEGCFIEHYKNNNGVVLKTKNDSVLIFIDGDCLGINENTIEDEFTRRAAPPIFKMMLNGHNNTWKRARDSGIAHHKQEVKNFLGIR